MRIIYVGTGTQSIGPKSKTAVELVINNLAESVKKLNNDITIIDLPDKEGNLNKSLKYFHITMPQFLENKKSSPGGMLHILKRIIFSFKAAFLIRKLSIKGKIDLVHIQNQYPGFLIMILKRYMKNTKFVYTSHTPFWTLDDLEFNKKYYIKTLMDRISMRLADRTIFVGNSQKENALRRAKLNPKKIEVIENGVDLKKFYPKKNNNKNKIVLSVARISRIKNQLLVIKVASKIIKYHKNIIFQFIGQFEEEDYLKEIDDFIKNNDLKDNIKIIGPVNNESLPKYYQNADIFVSASNAEGLPLTVLEAMASSCAIILSDIDPHKDIQKNNEIIYFKKGDLEDLKQKLEIVFDNKKLKYLKKKAFESAKKYFSWKTVAIKNLEVYKKAIQSSSP